MDNNEVLDKVKALLDYQKQRYPDIIIPSDDLLMSYIEDLANGNPYRVIYILILEDTLLKANQAENFSDDGISYKTGTGLSAMEALLPYYKKLAEDFDLDNSDEVFFVETPYDATGDMMLSWGV